MASYTQVQVVANAKAMCGDGLGNLYVATYSASNIVIYQYNIATDTLTDISGATFNNRYYGASDTGGSVLTWWSYNDKLYTVVCDLLAVPNDKIYCHRWDGGQNWTQVDSADITGGTSSYRPVLKSSPTRLAYRYTMSDYRIRGTADGSSWNQDFNSGAWSLYYDLSQYDALMTRYYDGANYLVHRNTGGAVWAALGAVDLGAITDFIGTNGTYSFFYGRLNQSIYYSSDWGDNQTDTGQDLYAPNSFTDGSVYDFTYQVVGLLSTTNNQDQVRFWNNATKTFDLDGTPVAGADLTQEPAYYNGYLYVLVEDVGIYVRDDPIGPVVAWDFDISNKYEAKAMDASADDDYVYVACLEGGNPVLLRLLSDLSADPTRQYEPGAGDAIAVIAGRQHDDWVWISGRFAGQDKVALSEDAGVSWTIEDPNTWAGRAYPPLIGPDDDERMIIATDQDDNLRETFDRGTAWTTQNTGLDFDVGDMDHLDIAPNELVMGANVAGAVRVEYSPSRGVAWADITGTTPNFETTTILCG